MQTAIEFLKTLEKLRNPFLDILFQLFTRFGEEIIISCVICILFWCINKEFAYRLGLSFFASTLLVQGLKVTFCVKRPFVIDPTLKPVKSAIKNATGYSFPSGHTQSATALYGTLFSSTDKKTIKWVCAVIIAAVGFSRLYLGVHTYIDVLAGFAVTALCLIFVRYCFKTTENIKTDTILSAGMLILSVFICIYSFLMSKYGKADISQINDCFKNGGAGFGFAIGYYIERKYIKFSVKTKKLWHQPIKLIAGAGIALLIKELPKVIFPPSLAVDFIRYFITISWVIVIYPLIFDRIINKKTKENK